MRKTTAKVVLKKTLKSDIILPYSNILEFIDNKTRLNTKNLILLYIIVLEFTQ